MVVHPAFLVVFFGVKKILLTPNSKLLTFIVFPCTKKQGQERNRISTALISYTKNLVQVMVCGMQKP